MCRRRPSECIVRMKNVICDFWFHDSRSFVERETRKYYFAVRPCLVDIWECTWLIWILGWIVEFDLVITLSREHNSKAMRASNISELSTLEQYWTDKPMCIYLLLLCKLTKLNTLVYNALFSFRVCWWNAYSQRVYNTWHEVKFVCELAWIFSTGWTIARSTRKTSAQIKLKREREVRTRGHKISMQKQVIKKHDLRP